MNAQGSMILGAFVFVLISLGFTIARSIRKNHPERLVWLAKIYHLIKLDQENKNEYGQKIRQADAFSSDESEVRCY